MDASWARLTLWVEGLVQGVGFRHHTRRQAQALGLTGWVQNLADGRVALVAEGPRAALEAMLAWCQRGPPAAEVRAVEPGWGPARGEFTRFEVRP